MKAVIQTAGAAGSKALGQSRAAALGEQRNDLRSQQEQHGSRESAPQGSVWKGRLAGACPAFQAW